VRCADAASIAEAARILVQGGTVAVPTETVYGLAARADSAEAVAAIYRAKGRPSFNPLIVHVPDLAAAEVLALFDARARTLAEAFWPGALTMVLPRRAHAPLSAAVSAGLSTVALRVPAHPVMRAVLAAAALPLAAPSANRSGAISPTRAEHVVRSLGERVDLILDGGSTEQGLESTIVAVRPGGDWAVLRPGPITEAAIAAILGPRTDGLRPAQAQIEAPGQLDSHYAPGKPVRLNVRLAEQDEFFIGFGEIAGVVSLSVKGDLAEAAARFYACLHFAAAATEARIAIAPIPDHGIGTAINDRLRRAAA